MCPDCGSEFTSGFGLINHKKFGKCNVQAVNTQLQDDLYEDFEIQHDLYEDSEISEWEPDNASLDIQATAAEVDGYMDSLRQMGTYDDKAVHQYLTLPARKPSAVEKEVCHFLHAVDHRQGTSNERTDKVLRYVKKLGGTAMLLPKKAKTCWDIVKKVGPAIFSSCWVQQLEQPLDPVACPAAGPSSRIQQLDPAANANYLAK